MWDESCCSPLRVIKNATQSLPEARHNERKQAPGSSLGPPHIDFHIALSKKPHIFMLLHQGLADILPVDYRISWGVICASKDLIHFLHTLLVGDHFFKCISPLGKYYLFKITNWNVILTFQSVLADALAVTALSLLGWISIRFPHIHFITLFQIHQIGCKKKLISKFCLQVLICFL